MKTKYFNFTKQELLFAIKNSNSLLKVLKYFKIPSKTIYYDELRKQIIKYDLENETKHFTSPTNRKRSSITDLNIIKEIINGNTNLDRKQIKARLFATNVKEKKCEKCGITQWNGQEAPLELHHIDGNNKNNKLENLEILCPNCHYQTPNHRGRNIKQKRGQKSDTI